MRSTLLALILLLTVSISAQEAAYSRVKIFTSSAGMNQLALAGITIDHGEYKPGCCFTSTKICQLNEILLQKSKQ